MWISERIFNEAVDVNLASEEGYELCLAICENTDLETDDIIGIYRVEKDSLLYEALTNWYWQKGISYTPYEYEDATAIYFEHGYNYKTSDEFVGGDGSGRKTKEFLRWLNEFDEVEDD